MSDTPSSIPEIALLPSDDEERIGAAILKVLRSPDYAAFQSLPVRGRQRPRLLLVPGSGPWEWISNAALWRMRANPDGSEIGLSFHTAGVLITGRSLLSAAFAIDAHQCLFLQEYNSDRHGPLAK